jgi:hypothetical protein
LIADPTPDPLDERDVCTGWRGYAESECNIPVRKAGELTERANGGEAQVAGSRTIAALLFDVVQEGSNEIRSEVR